MRLKKVKQLKSLLSEIEQHMPLKDKRNPKVSKSDIAWQLDHILKVINLVSKSIANSNPTDYKWQFNKWRALLFALNYIPRGKAKAPKVVRPPEVITEKDLKIQLSNAYTNIDLIASLDENSNFKHFVFGQLNKKQTIKFLRMHTKHHLKIIRDIVK